MARLLRAGQGQLRAIKTQQSRVLPMLQLTQQELTALPLTRLIQLRAKTEDTLLRVASTTNFEARTKLQALQAILNLVISTKNATR